MFIHKMTRTSILALTTLTLATSIVAPRAAQAGPLPDLSNQFIYFNINRAYSSYSIPDGFLEIKTVNTASGELEGQLSIKKEPSRRATGRIVLEGSSGPYGPNTCLQGYVWREAVPRDYVCVTPQTRDQTAYDNSQDSVRKVTLPPGSGFGPRYCLQGYVWREAVPTDDVCVTPQTRDQTAYDNSQAAKRRLGTLRITFATGKTLFLGGFTGGAYSFTAELRDAGVERNQQQWDVNGSYTFNVTRPSSPVPFEGSTIRNFIH